MPADRREINTHNQFTGHIKRARTVMGDIKEYPTPTSYAKHLAYEIDILLLKLDTEIRTYRVDGNLITCLQK